MINRIFIFLIVALVSYSCASTKKMADTSIGAWDYTITGTPEGDLNGTFVIAKDGDAYTGVLKSTQGEIDLNNVVVEDGNLSCDFDYMGYTVNMSGLFEGSTFDGKVSVDYNDFPMTAEKQ